MSSWTATRPPNSSWRINPGPWQSSLKERVYIYEFAVFLRAHVPGFEEATLHVVAPLTCARGGNSIARMLLPVQVDGSQRQAEDLSPLQVQAHRDLPSRQRAQIAAATPGDHASQLVTDQRIGSVETAAGQAIDQLRRRVRQPDECDGKMPYASRNG